MSSKFDEFYETMTQMVMLKTMQKMVDALEKQNTEQNQLATSAKSSVSDSQHGTTMSVEEFLRLSDNELAEREHAADLEQPCSYTSSRTERAEESKLRKLGYSVANNSGLSEKQRQGLLESAIENGVVSKGYVITYLENNIRINGRKESNGVAVYKWKRDLEFVRQLESVKYGKMKNH